MKLILHISFHQWWHLQLFKKFHICHCCFMIYHYCLWLLIQSLCFYHTFNFSSFLNVITKKSLHLIIYLLRKYTAKQSGNFVCDKTTNRFMSCVRQDITRYYWTAHSKSTCLMYLLNLSSTVVVHYRNTVDILPKQILIYGYVWPMGYFSMKWLDDIEDQGHSFRIRPEKGLCACYMIIWVFIIWIWQNLGWDGSRVT